MTLNRAAEAYVKYEKKSTAVFGRLDSPLHYTQTDRGRKRDGRAEASREEGTTVVGYMVCVIFRRTRI